MIKTIMRKIFSFNKDTIITTSSGNKLELKKDCRFNGEIMKEFFEKERKEDILGVIIRVKDGDKERVCSLMIAEDTCFLMDEEATKKSLSESGENLSIKLPQNETAEEFEDIFGKVDHPNIKRARDLLFDD